MAASAPQADGKPPLSDKPKVYRSPVPTAAGTVLAVVLIAAGLVLIGTIRQGGATVVVAGAAAVIIGAAIGASVRNSYLSVAPGGITCSYGFRRQQVRWSDIQEFEIVPARGQGLAAWTLTVRLPEGPISARGIAGRREYLEKIVTDLRTLQQAYGPSAGQDR
jgi:hypothetical protein